MFKNFNVLWGIAVPFDIEKRGLYMVYYGIYVKSFFIGVSRLVDKNQLHFKPRPLKMA
jgi:hypothetical protein